MRTRSTGSGRRWPRPRARTSSRSICSATEIPTTRRRLRAPTTRPSTSLQRRRAGRARRLDGESPPTGPCCWATDGRWHCTLLAAAYADRVRALALCEGLGPLAQPADRAPANAQGARRALRPAADAPSRGRDFSSVDAAARARVMGARKWQAGAAAAPQRGRGAADRRARHRRRRRRGALRSRPRARAAAADVHRRGDVAELLPRDRVPGARGAGRRRLAAPRAGLHHAVRGARRSSHAR